MYMINPALPAAIKRAFGPIYRLLENKYYMDWFNENVLARAHARWAPAFWKGGDQALIDGAVVNGSWKVIGRISGVVRWMQSGYIYHYAFAMLLGIFVLMTYFVWFNTLSLALEKKKNGFVEPCHLGADRLRRRAAGVRP